MEGDAMSPKSRKPEAEKRATTARPARKAAARPAPKEGKAPAEPLARSQAIILAGGSGTRLWPLSRTLLPKQLLALNGSQSLLQQTVARALTFFAPEHIWIVTNEEHVFEVRSQVASVHKDLDHQVLAEPVGRNTLPAILLGLDRIVAEAPSERSAGELPVAVFPSDHMIGDVAGWRESLARGVELAGQGYFVTFGVRPTKPETGYGYIEQGQSLTKDAFAVKGFKEKPDLATAQGYLASERYFWNSGMFVFSAKTFLDAVHAHTPELWSWWKGRKTHPLTAGYATIPSESVDYGIAERVARQAVVRAAFDWDDLGSWEALYRLNDKDDSGCVLQGDVLALDCHGCLLLSNGGKLAAVGLKDLVVVQTRDATLVCPSDQVQRVKDVVATLKAEGSQLVEAHVTVHRPWGSYTVLEESAGFKVKRITVKPGARLSLQMHHHRSEHWVVIRGAALAEVNGVEHLLTENQSVDIPKAATHRLSNPGKVLVEIIEVQSGPYLEEDDIVRFDDVYGRRTAAKA